MEMNLNLLKDSPLNFFKIEPVPGSFFSRVFRVTKIESLTVVRQAYRILFHVNQIGTNSLLFFQPG